MPTQQTVKSRREFVADWIKVGYAGTYAALYGYLSDSCEEKGFPRKLSKQKSSAVRKAIEQIEAAVHRPSLNRIE